MKFKKSVSDTLTSLAIIAISVLIILLIAYAKSNRTFDFFGLAFLFVYTLLFAAGMGIGLLVIRAFRISKERLGITYNLFGLLNLLIGLFGLVSIAIRNNQEGWQIFAIAFLIGLLINTDIFLQK